ncbi:MAG: hypothetical protein ACXW30_00165 [Micavibrio sp.]
MKKVILHIGQSKTGTTSLQAFLSENRKGLEQQGVLYPDCFLNNVPLQMQNHNSLGDALYGSNRYPYLSAEQYFSQFYEQCGKSGCDTLLLSGESFFGGAPQIWDLKDNENYFDLYKEKLKRLRSNLRDFSCDVVLYVRRQEDWLESAIAQIVRYQGLLNNIRYENDDQILNVLAPRMQYAMLTDFWEEIVKPEKMSVIPYDRETLKKGDIIFDFLFRVGLVDLATTNLSHKPEDHKSLDRRLFWLKHELNQVPKDKDHERTILKLLETMNDNIRDHKKYTIHSALKKKCASRFHDENQRLAAKYNLENAAFFRQRQDDDTDQVSQLPDAAEQQQVREVFDVAYRSFHGRKTLIYMKVNRLLRQKIPFVHALLRHTKGMIMASKTISSISRKKGPETF